MSAFLDTTNLISLDFSAVIGKKLSPILDKIGYLSTKSPYMTNEFLAEILKCSTRTITRHLAELSELKAITIETKTFSNKDGNPIEDRKIFLNFDVLFSLFPQEKFLAAFKRISEWLNRLKDISSRWTKWLPLNTNKYKSININNTKKIISKEQPAKIIETSQTGATPMDNFPIRVKEVYENYILEGGDIGRLDSLTCAMANKLYNTHGGDDKAEKKIISALIECSKSDELMGRIPGRKRYGLPMDLRWFLNCDNFEIVIHKQEKSKYQQKKNKSDEDLVIKIKEKIQENSNESKTVKEIRAILLGSIGGRAYASWFETKPITQDELKKFVIYTETKWQADEIMLKFSNILESTFGKNNFRLQPIKA